MTKVEDGSAQFYLDYAKGLPRDPEGDRQRMLKRREETKFHTLVTGIILSTAAVVLGGGSSDKSTEVKK